jgi:hypothetical protein
MSKSYKSLKRLMFLNQFINEKRIIGCIQTSSGSESYVNQSVFSSAKQMSDRTQRT